MAKTISVQTLSGVPRTLLFPVYARAQERLMKQPLFDDPYSVDMVAKIDFDFSIFADMPESMTAARRDLQAGIAVRTELIDKGVKVFLVNHPKGLVVNMGCGLDARFFRLDNGSMTWIDVDLAEVIDIRQQFFEENDRYQMLAASILDRGWLESILPQNGQKVLLIAEGTLMYFQEEAVKTLFRNLIEKFPRSGFLFEVMGNALAGKVHPSVKCLGQDIICPWGIGDYTAMEDWSDQLTLTRADFFIDQHRSRWTWPLRILTRLFPQNKPKFGHAIVQMEIT